MNYSNVKVYATKTCPYCTMVADWLKSKNVAFEKVLVDQDQTAAKEMVEKTGQMGVPVIEISYLDRKSEYVVGFNQPQLTYMLGV
ncbi:MAG: glutaredoxin family protein [Microgenomates group bacterium]